MYGQPSGFDRTRNVEIGNKNIKLKHLEEAYTSDHWLVRIYRYRQMIVCIVLKGGMKLGVAHGV